MPQFAVHKNKNSATRAKFPLLVDIQSDLIQPLATRVVIPLSPAARARSRSIELLSPIVTVGDLDYVLVTPQLAGIASKELGPVVGSLRDQRARIIGALDFLISAY